MRTKTPHCKASPACDALASGTIRILGIEVPACAAHIALARTTAREATRQWCLNTKTGEIFSYHESGGLTDFPRGVLLAYGDYLVTGYDSREEANEAGRKHWPCPKCKGSTSGDKCFRCGTDREGLKHA